MWHIVAIGYLFVAVMFSAAQPSIARALIYLVFWAVLPTVFTVFVVTIRRRNRRSLKRPAKRRYRRMENRTERYKIPFQTASYPL